MQLTHGSQKNPQQRRRQAEVNNTCSKHTGGHCYSKHKRRLPLNKRRLQQSQEKAAAKQEEATATTRRRLPLYKRRLEAIQEEAASYNNQNRPLPQQDNKGRSHRNFQEAVDLEQETTTLAQEHNRMSRR